MVVPQPGERSYHAFYQLLVGADQQMRDSFALWTPGLSFLLFISFYPFAHFLLQRTMAICTVLALTKSMVSMMSR